MSGICDECEEGSRTMDRELKIREINPNYNITFYKDNRILGKMDFNGPKMIFTGEAEESAKIFMDQIARSFSCRLKDERDKCAKLVDHILKEGGGTYGDDIRNL